MKLTKPVLMGFASFWLLGAYLVHPILASIALVIFIATLGYQ